MRPQNSAVDYWHKLSPEETRWLRAFEREYERGYRDGNLITNIDDQRAVDRRRAAYRRDLLNVCVPLTENEPKPYQIISRLILRDFIEKTQDINFLPMVLL